MERIYGRSAAQGPMPNSFCPGCSYGNVMKITCEAATELNLQDRLVLGDGVGCYAPRLT